MRSKLAKILCAVLALAMIVSVAACGGNETPTTTPSEPSTPADTSTADEPAADEPAADEPAVEEPAGDQIFRVAVTSLNGRFTPITSANVYDAYVVSLVFDGLISNNTEGEPIPWIADWETSADDLTYTFTLWDGITFSDGTALTTTDVAFTFNAIAHPDYDGARVYDIQNMKGFADTGTLDAAIEIIDEKTIAFTFEEAGPNNIWSFGYGIMPEHIYGFTDWNEFLDKEGSPVGSGRFLFEEWRPMEYARFTTNANHWNADRKANIDGILMMEIPNELLVDALGTGQVDAVQVSTTLDNYNALLGLDNAHPFVFMGNGFQFMAFNTTLPQLSDYRVRQALMYALDRQAYVDNALGGTLGVVGTAPISPVSWAFPDASTLNSYAFNMDRARELIADAGWEIGPSGFLEKDGVVMTIEWPVYTEVEWPSIMANLAADTWGQLGVDLQIELTDFNTVGEVFDQEPGEKAFGVFVMGFSLSIDPDPTGGLNDADAFVAGGWNTDGLRNARAQELIAQGAREVDQSVREEIYAEWAQIMNEQVGTFIVAYRFETWGVSNRVNNMVIEAYRDWTFEIHNITIS